MQRSDQILCQLLQDSAAQSVLLLGNRAASVASELPVAVAAGITSESWQNLVLHPGPVVAGKAHSGFLLRNLADFDLVYLTDLPVDEVSSPTGPGLIQCLALIKSHCQGELLFEFASRTGLATDNRFSALGFSRALLSAESEGRFAVYSYSLHSYKSPPDWLNSRHWANPERWNQD